MSEKPNRIIQIGILVGYLGTVLVNALANILPINGVNTGQLSDEIPNLFVPAGLTFSVWGVIYFMLALFTGYSIMDWISKKEQDLSHVSEIGGVFILSSVANISWILFWHYRLVGISLIAMLIILGSLIYMHVVLYRKSPAPNTWKRRWFVKYPISIYLGWITVATVANVVAVLVVNNWNGFGLSESLWTIIMIVIAGLITLVMVWREQDIPYALVVIWAFAGIIIKRVDPMNSPQVGIVVTTAIMIGLILVASIYSLFKRNKK